MSSIHRPENVFDVENTNTKIKTKQYNCNYYSELRPTKPGWRTSTGTWGTTCKSELAQPIRCRLRAYLLLIHYIMLWPWTLTPWPWPFTLNLHSVSSVTWWNSVRKLSKIGQSAAEFLQFELWSYDLENVSRVLLCCVIVCTKFKLSQATRSWNVTIFSR